MRNVCGVGIDTVDRQKDEFGFDIPDTGTVVICGKPAVDYYITDEYEKFWMCSYHWDQHALCCRNVGIKNPRFDDHPDYLAHIRL